jgi:hypothetical protein
MARVPVFNYLVDVLGQCGHNLVIGEKPEGPPPM